MRREDLGFVLSRIMAVFIFVYAVPKLFYIPEYLQLEDKRQVWIGIVPVAAQIAAAWVLWTFPHLVGGKPTEGDVKLEARDLRSALFAGVGLYFLVTGLIGIVDFLFIRFGPYGVDMVRGLKLTWLDSVVEAAAGAALVFWFGGAPKKFSDPWKLTDDSEEA